jgi:hypothetical protein
MRGATMTEAINTSRCLLLWSLLLNINDSAHSITSSCETGFGTTFGPMCHLRLEALSIRPVVRDGQFDIGAEHAGFLGAERSCKCAPQAGIQANSRLGHKLSKTKDLSESGRTLTRDGQGAAIQRGSRPVWKSLKLKI